MIDIESGGSGTRALDYARLLRDTHFPHRVPEPGVPEIIKVAGGTVAGPAVLAVCTSAAVLDNLCWRVQVQHPRLPQLIPAFLDLADDLERNSA